MLRRDPYGYSRLPGYRERSRHPMKGATVTLSIDIPFTHALALWAGSETVHEQGGLPKRYPLTLVTKLCTAWSALVAVEHGLCLPNDPVGSEGSTVRHLLAHASGLPYESHGLWFSTVKRRVYSNAGFEILGDVLEEASGSPVKRWIEGAVFEPLGVTTVKLVGSPAWVGMASIEDLLILGHKMLEPTLTSPELAREAMTPRFPRLVGAVPGYGRHTPYPWGLGIEVRGDESSHWTGSSFPADTAGRFGVSDSFLWVGHTHGATCASLGAEKFDAWHKEHWGTMNEELPTPVLR